MKAKLHTCLFGAVVCAMMAAGTTARADSPRGLVSKGNRQYGRKAFGEALEYYDRASVKAPESPIVAFNKGAALYKQGDLEKAREMFREAASKTRSLPFEAKAWYNLGNVAFREGERQEDSDLRKALAALEESVRSYMTALEKDPDLDEAAENLEIARLKIKDILDRLKNQQQDQQGAQQQQQQQQGGEGQDREPNRQQEEQLAAEQNQERQEEQQAAQNEEKEKPLARDETARKILDEEKENRKERQRQEGRSTHRPVGKDW